MKAVNKIKKPKLTKGDWVWIAFAILLFLGGGLAGLFFIFCLWLFVFSVRKCIASIKLSAEQKKKQGRKRTMDVKTTQNNESVVVEKQKYSPSWTTESLNERENMSHDGDQRKTKKKVIKGPAYPTYTIPEVKSFSRNEKRCLNSYTPNSLKDLFSEDERCEIEWLLGLDEDFLDQDYDIADEYYQEGFKKAKLGLCETITVNSIQKYSILRDGEKYYFVALSGCTCKKYENEGFCEHMMINALNQKLIDPVNGIRFNDNAMNEKFEFINQNIIGTNGNVLKVKTGFVKQSCVPTYFIEKGFFKISSEIQQLVHYLSKSQIHELIPTLKDDLKRIDPAIKMKSLRAGDLRELIVKNQHIFQKYFRGYVYVELKEEVEDQISECEDLVNWIVYTNKKYR